MKNENKKFVNFFLTCYLLPVKSWNTKKSTFKFKYVKYMIYIQNKRVIQGFVRVNGREKKRGRIEGIYVDTTVT